MDIGLAVIGVLVTFFWNGNKKPVLVVAGMNISQMSWANTSISFLIKKGIPSGKYLYVHNVNGTVNKIGQFI